MIVVPLNDMVLLKLAAPETKTMAGLYIPTEVAKLNKTGEGIVLAIGHEVKGIKVGDIVVFNPYTVISSTEKDELLCHEKHIYGVIKNG